MDKLETHELLDLRKAYGDATFVSAERNIGLDTLKEHIRELIEEDFVTKTMEIPQAKYEGVAFLHRVANIHEQEYVKSHVKLTFSISEQNLLRLKHMLHNVDEEEPLAEE